LDFPRLPRAEFRPRGLNEGAPARGHLRDL